MSSRAYFCRQFPQLIGNIAQNASARFSFSTKNSAKNPCHQWRTIWYLREISLIWIRYNDQYYVSLNHFTVTRPINSWKYSQLQMNPIKYRHNKWANIYVRMQALILCQQLENWSNRLLKLQSAVVICLVLTSVFTMWRCAAYIVRNQWLDFLILIATWRAHMRSHAHTPIDRNPF